MKGLKICGISDHKILKDILNHNHRPTMIGFITNYKKSRIFEQAENRMHAQQALLSCLLS